ncbi:MAG: ComF family protein [Clostridia bacterium]|nr:ComF family protein [Clostridia bacterium]
MKFLEYVKRLICPPSCACCKKILDISDNSVFCNECYEELAKRVMDVAGENKSQYIERSYFYYRYKNWYVKNVISHTKYVANKEFLKFIGKRGKESLKKHNLLGQLDVVTFTPRRPGLVRLYGFDQAEELAMAISEQTDIPCSKLLKRKGFSLEQKSLKSSARSKNVEGKFRCKENLTGKRVLLVDDVVTTGSTVNECAKMLRQCGAKSVYVWSIAQ